MYKFLNIHINTRQYFNLHVFWELNQKNSCSYMDNVSDDEILLGFNSIIHSLKSLSNHCDVKLSLMKQQSIHSLSTISYISY